MSFTSHKHDSHRQCISVWTLYAGNQRQKCLKIHIVQIETEEWKRQQLKQKQITTHRWRKKNAIHETRNEATNDRYSIAWENKNLNPESEYKKEKKKKQLKIILPSQIHARKVVARINFVLFIWKKKKCCDHLHLMNTVTRLHRKEMMNYERWIWAIKMWLN